MTSPHAPRIVMPPADAITLAAEQLAAGELVAFPTETVYGLGGDAENPAAVAAIYAAKGRPANHPVIVHFSPEGDPGYWSDDVTPAARKLMDAFWPGPLTLILKRAPHIPDAVSGGQDSVGVRCPSHPVAQALLREFARIKGGQGGVAGPSANRFGQVSPTAAQHVRDEFAGLPGVTVHVLDGGEAAVGIESTIVDLSRGFPALLRPGHISPGQIAEVLGEMPRLPGQDSDAPRASGTLKAHYAPRTPLYLCEAGQFAPALAVRPDAERVAVVAFAPTLATLPASVATSNDVVKIVLPATPAALATDLYAMLRRLDRANVTHILFERLPDTPEWAAVGDRLGRAAAAFERA
ncbi:threonylcarbamoyl-AMP synthase [Pandoraea fibrosis]|uniref:Threonylcarbamoyl-AMP synthase n=1 Tax=Pandoraea fibrosis TaxID=1891094 RepID=A0ABX6HPV5_9BURK|nr:L-threonylcarbamoyladenylate synthase [Pandoraea fibrosis]QHE93507.1 threonylcarbamoyl-AMP synthase [Pandoraea fibrosis]QHF12931.1 threonylcarbamoyl-AMP synthase [Pandoraea fibrosis]